MSHKEIFFKWSENGIDTDLDEVYIQATMKTKPKPRFDPRRIREARIMLGKTHDEFGAAIKKTGRTIVNWEKGATSPTIRELEALCDHYGLDVSFFLNAKVA